LVINQLLGVYECYNEILLDYFEESRQLLDEFVSVILEHIPKAQNEEANRLAQFASGYRLRASILFDDVLPNDWRKEILDYLKNPSQRVSKKLKSKALKYVLLEEYLYYRTIDGVLLKCLSEEEVKLIMDEVHEGICGAHQLAYKMKLVIRRSGYF
jgi:hypothetical protein